MTVEDSEKFIEYVYEKSFSLNHLMNRSQELTEVTHFAIKKASDELLGNGQLGKFNLPILGEILFPFTSFGKTSSISLLNFHELCLFKIYSLISKNYSTALDLGANIGLHSIVMSKAGFEKIIAVEADINHFERFDTNLSINNVNNVDFKNIAVSDKSGFVRFTRVLDNLTGSHIYGSKEKIYGELAEITVESKPITEFLVHGQKTFIKMDIESHESIAISQISKSFWSDIDMCLEIGNLQNAKNIYDYCKINKLFMFSQKFDWNVIENVEQLPKHWKDGSVFISSNLHFIDEILQEI